MRREGDALAVAARRVVVIAVGRCILVVWVCLSGMMVGINSEVWVEV